ncbi:hypothetical protein [Pollutibacter soli]|uniref:hypothetical protein n=1 Tax=Pollutibacter soli TaxID=3034157 RepID=UPI003013DB12
MKYFIMIFIFFTLQRKENNHLRVQVIDDNGKGIKSAIFICKSGDNFEDFGLTDEYGYFELPCATNQKIQARPFSPFHLRSQVKYCLEIMNVIYVPLYSYTESQLIDANLNFKNKNFGVAAVLYYDLAQTTSGHDSVTAKNYSQRALLSLGLEFNITNGAVFDSISQEFKPNKELQKEIINVQKKNKIPATGEIDALTLKFTVGDEKSTIEYFKKNRPKSF